MHTQLTPDTDALPFLVVQGGWFWIVFVIAFAVTVVGVVGITRHVVAVVRARAVLAKLSAAIISTLVEGNAVVAGRWHRDEIVVGDEHVVLGENPRVVLGSRGDRIENDADVIVSGELVRIANARPATTGYRENAGTWRLDGAEIYATKARIRAQPLPWPARIIGFVLALMAGYVSLHITGGKLVERIERRDVRTSDGHPLRVEELDAISIAASLPGSRDKALEKFAAALEEHPYRDDQSVRRQLGLDRLIHGACSSLRILRARLDEQLAMARRCHYDRAVFNILVDLGRYEEAWNSRPPDLDLPDREGMVAIAIGNWAGAAAQADKMADLAHTNASRGECIQRRRRARHISGSCPPPSLPRAVVSHSGG